MIEQFFNGLFVILILLSPICLIIGLIKPSIFSHIFRKELNRKKISLIFGIVFVVSFVLFGITTSPSSQSSTATPAVTRSGPTLTDSQYIDAIQTNFIPHVQSAENYIIDPTIDVGDLDDKVSTKQQSAQTEFSAAQKGLGSLGQAPSDLSKADGLLNQGIGDQISGINNIVSAIKNSLTNVDDFTYLDPDTALQGFSSLDKGATEENQALNLIEASKGVSVAQASAIKDEIKGFGDQISLYQSVEGKLKPRQSLEASIKNNISQLGYGIQGSYKNLRVEKADSDRPMGTTMINVGVNIGEFLDKNALIDLTNKLSAKLFQTVFSSNINAYDVFVSYFGQTTDEYGNQKNEAVLVYGLDKDTYNKISWSGFDQSTFCDFLKQQGAVEGGTGSDDCNVLVNIK